jgi:hypothetical protein
VEEETSILRPEYPPPWREGLFFSEILETICQTTRCHNQKDRGTHCMLRSWQSLNCSRYSLSSYGTRRIITMLTRAHHWSLSWARWVHFTPTRLIMTYSGQMHNRDRILVVTAGAREPLTECLLIPGAACPTEVTDSLTSM